MRPTRLGIMCILLAGLVVFPLASATSAADNPVTAALKTAFFHANELAQKGAAVETSLLHVQHVMNCLEGPNGKNVKAAAGFPCQGNGIIPDLTAAAGAGVRGAEAALGSAKVAWNVAQRALTLKDVNEVQPFAKVIASYLQKALDSLQ